jgi:hypothetical protein
MNFEFETRTSGNSHLEHRGFVNCNIRGEVGRGPGRRETDVESSYRSRWLSLSSDEGIHTLGH